MRRLGYGLVALAIVLIALSAGVVGWQRWEAWRNLAPARNAGLDERVLFEAAGAKELLFNASTHQGWFALQGFVVAPFAVRARGLPVTLEVGLHGDLGVIRERRYLALPAVEIPRPYGLLDGRPEQATWVLPTEWIDLTGRPDVQAVSVRVLDRAAGIQTVLWRGAIDQRLTDAQVTLRYRRLSDASRDELTEDWVMPSSVVAPEVKQELLRYRQQRIGPLGRPGDAFVARRVLRRVPSSLARRYAVRPLALRISPSMHVSVALDEAREIRLDARDADGRPLAIAVEGPFAGSRNPAVKTINGAWQGTWAAGRYVLRSRTAGDVDVREVASGDALIPSGLRPRMHRAASGRALEYPLYTLGEAPPAVRLRLRAEHADASVVGEFLDADGRPLASHTINVPMRASAYDRPSAALDTAASVAVRFDVQPPAQARTLRITSAGPVLVHALTTLWRGGSIRGRRWYSFQPTLDPRSVRAQGVVVVEQPRPGRARSSDADNIAARIALRAHGARVRTRDEPARVIATRPRLRLRPEREDREEDHNAP